MGGYPVAPPLGMCTGLASDSDTVEEGAGTLYKRDTVLSVLPYEMCACSLPPTTCIPSLWTP